MGTIYNYSKEDEEEETKIKEELSNIKGPSFYLNKEFPNYKKIPLFFGKTNLFVSKYLQNEKTFH
jgi:hypothetical protein